MWFAEGSQRMRSQGRLALLQASEWAPPVTTPRLFHSPFDGNHFGVLFLAGNVSGMMRHATFPACPALATPLSPLSSRLDLLIHSESSTYQTIQASPLEAILTDPQDSTLSPLEAHSCRHASNNPFGSTFLRETGGGGYFSTASGQILSSASLKSYRAPNRTRITNPAAPNGSGAQRQLRTAGC